MAYQDLDSTSVSELRNISYSAGFEPWNTVLNSYSIGEQDTDTSEYICDWSKWHGYYRTRPLLKAVIDKLAMWTVGKGFKAPENQKKILERIRGQGKDTFNSLLFNMSRTMKIGGDFYGEITRDKGNRLTNIKALNPGMMKIVSNKKGIITGYEQVEFKNDIKSKDMRVLAKWAPHEILHLSNFRIADEIHGIPLTESLQATIKQFDIAIDDMTVVFHRYVKPLLVWQLDTDDTTEIAAFKTKAEQAVKEMENMYVPRDTADLERMSIPQYSTLDPLPWIKMLQTNFIRAAGVPEIILGHSEEESEATAKIIYLAFQQTIEWEQKYLIEQLKAQLGIEIDLEFPASIDPAIMTDSRKNTGNAITQTNPTNERKSDGRT